MGLRLRASIVLVAVVLVAPLVTALAPPMRAATEEKDAHPLVRLAILTKGPIDLPTVGGDARVGFVVVETRDVSALAAVFGDRLVPNAAARADAAPDDSLWSFQWGPQALDLTSAWSIENGTTSVKVAVIDSGIDDSHPDFAGVPIEAGTDYVDGDATPQDEAGHGTHVAGIIAAARDNGLGIAGIARVTLVPIRVLDNEGDGNCIDVALAVLEAVSRGASVINLSLDCSSDYPPLHLAIQSATQAGVLVVAAAGNTGAHGPCVFPGAYPEVLSVAALDTATTVASYSCRGATVEIAAPGSGIISTWRDGGYLNLSGTSMATPHVSGIAALVKAHFPALDGAGIRARLDATAVDLGPVGRDDASGYGRVDPVAALTS